jgi:hypothetical protein
VGTSIYLCDISSSHTLVKRHIAKRSRRMSVIVQIFFVFMLVTNHKEVRAVTIFIGAQLHIFSLPTFPSRSKSIFWNKSTAKRAEGCVYMSVWVRTLLHVHAVCMLRVCASCVHARACCVYVCLSVHFTACACCMLACAQTCFNAYFTACACCMLACVQTCFNAYFTACACSMFVCKSAATRSCLYPLCLCRCYNL